MSLDGRFLSFLSKELNQELQNGRIQKIYQLTKTDFLFLVRANSKNRMLLISLSTSQARIHLTRYDVDRPDNPGGYCMLLRKYLEGAIINDIRTLNSDRIMDISLENLNEIGDMTQYHLIMEIMGRYANLIVTDGEHRIIDAFRHVPPFEDKERTIIKGIHYVLPEDGKIQPDDVEQADRFFDSQSEFTYQDLIGKFKGFSPLLSKYLIRTAKSRSIPLKEAFHGLLKEPVVPTRFLSDAQQRFYYFDLFEGEGNKIHYDTLSDLLDEVYLESGKIERMKQLSKNIYQLAKREFDKNSSKLEKLTQELDAAKNSDELRRKGDMIQQNLYSIKRGDSSLLAYDYVSGQEISIELDRLLDPIQNANQYYRKYKKAKTAVAHIEEQISITERQISYFDILITQIETASVNDLDEIKEELASLGFIRSRGKKTRKGRPGYDTYQLDNGTIIHVGKNNLQNEYLTHKVAKSNEWWFHTKDIHGSHVIVAKSGDLNETEIRAAAMVASYFSKGRLSSSVPVDYTLVRHVKKIPGELGSLVQYTNHKTIYIDPDPMTIASFKKKKN